MNISITIVRYQGTSVMSSGNYVGITGTGANWKVRIAFTPTQPLNAITFRVVGSTKSYADAKTFSYGIMTAETNAPASPYVATATWYTLPAGTTGTIDETVTVEADFAANQTYYLWLWGAPAGGYAYITYSSITLTGVLTGLAHLDTGTAIVSVLPYIDDGTTLVACIPYVDNGIDWEVMT